MSQGISIDSTALRIPLEIASPLSDKARAICGSDGRYIQNIQTIDLETGILMHEDTKPGAKNFTDTDQVTGEIYTRYWIRIDRHNGDDLVQCLNIGIHSKHLGTDMLTGITRETLPQAMGTILSQGHFEFDISHAVLHGRFTQTDLKKDLQMSDAEYEQMKKGLISSTRETKYQAKALKNWGHGIEWGNRESKKHYKTYHKSKQMLSEHPMFTQTYLPQLPGDLVRFETKIAGAKEFKGYGFKDNKIETILAASQQQLDQVMHKQFAQVIDFKELDKLDTSKKQQRQTQEQHLTIMLFEQLTNQGYSTSRILDSITNHIRNRAQRSKKRRQVQTWFNEWQNSKYQAFNSRHFFSEFWQA